MEVSRVVRDKVWPGTSSKARKRNVRYITLVNSKDEGAGRVMYAKGEGAGCVMYAKDEGEGRAVYAKGEGTGRDVYAKDEGMGRDVYAKDEATGREKVARRIKGGGKRASRWVKMVMGGEELDLYCDTGSNITIITPDMYKESMGKVVAAKSYLRAWGSDNYLDTKGMFKTTLTTFSGAMKRTWVYVVAGARPELLLGDHDAEDLGIISFHPEGRHHRGPDKDGNDYKDVMNVSIPAKLRKAGREVITEWPPLHKVKTKGKEEATKIVNGYKGSVFTDRVGKMKIEAVELKFEDGFKPVQRARYPVLYHYRERLATHLRKLEAEGVVEKVNPAEPIDCILNIAISEKKTLGSICMNIDARPYNKEAKHTRYHVTTPQEARHQLKGAKVFSEFDMGNGFHQVPLATCSQVVFQWHIGLHRMKRLFFGPTNSSGIFHHKVTKVFTGLKGCITIHDNLLVFGKDEDEHNRNMAGMLERAKEKGVNLKLAKSMICAAEVKWFGRVYLAAGVSADPDKIDHIVRAGRPETIEDV